MFVFCIVLFLESGSTTAMLKTDNYVFFLWINPPLCSVLYRNFGCVESSTLNAVFCFFNPFSELMHFNWAQAGPKNINRRADLAQWIRARMWKRIDLELNMLLTQSNLIFRDHLNMNEYQRVEKDWWPYTNPKNPFGYRNVNASYYNDLRLIDQRPCFWGDF